MGRPRRAEHPQPELLSTDAASAAAVLAALSRSQRRAVFADDESPLETYQAQRQQAMTDARIGEPPPGAGVERTEAAQIAEGVEWAMGPLVRLVETGFKIVGWTWLGSGLIAIALSWLTGGAPGSETDGWSFAGIPAFFFIISVISFPLAGIGLLLRNSLHGLRKRRQRAALLRWAVERPGQLARGLPGWPTGGGDPPVSGWLNLGVWVGGMLGALAGLFGFAILLIGLANGDDQAMLAGPVIMVVAAVAGVLAIVARRAHRRVLHDDRWADAGLRWVWEGRLPQDSHAADRALGVSQPGASEHPLEEATETRATDPAP